MRSVNTRDRAGTGLEALLTHGAGEGLKTCILFVPGVPGAWLDDIVSILGRRPGPFRVLIGVDGISSHPLRHWLRRLLLKETQAPGAPAEGVRRVFEALSPVAAEVWMLDRFTGETILPQ
ncbi:MAG: hypothetical protein HYS12_20435 [Planctomycetes bacterium]|nr:hypothetical protein [Planctomycetota bacterium]